MTTILILLSILIAGVLSYFQYFYKTKSKPKINLFLAFLRFISIFGLLLLLINPIISRKTYEIIKTPLPIVIDNSKSIIDLKANQIALQTFNLLGTNKQLKEKFDLQLYQFDNDFQTADSINFKGKQTNIDQVAKNLKSINKNSVFPTVLITDGNQTSGSDYVFSFDSDNKVYPVIVGDTTRVLDLKINQINVNKYAFVKNKFPVEVFLQYSGDKNCNANFSISQGKTILHKQSISFSRTNKSQIISVLLPAEKVGLQIFKAQITSNISEKNTFNNSKNFAVEVIDQRSNIAIISSTNHPDIGALKRSIESNAQRKVTIFKPNEINKLTDFNVLILYQPNVDFKSIFESNKIADVNAFVITGTNTDFNFLNQQQAYFSFKMSNQKEDYLATFDSQFNLFATENIGFENFPPLQNSFGSIVSNTANTVLFNSKIRNIETKTPLLTFVENGGKRNAYLFGENIWKWRLQSHASSKSYQSFDVFIDKIIQFLATSSSKKSLAVSHENFYNSGESIEISAQYFNKNYEFDENAQLSITVVNKENNQTKKYDLLKTNTAFKVNLDGLAAGKYSFAVKELSSKTVYNSSFEILDFDIEKQFVNPDKSKLLQLATQTNAKLIYPSQLDFLIKNLLENKDYQSVQKTIVKKSPFIDWVWLLILIVFSLSGEWFIRKYNGML
jgi:hypothetical protein